MELRLHLLPAGLSPGSADAERVRYVARITAIADSERVLHAMASPDARRAREEARQLFRELKELSEETGTRLTVLVIPDQLRASAASPGPAVYEVAAEEQRIVESFGALFDALGIAWAYPWEEMSRAIREGRPAYPTSDDRHPLALGYAIYARAAADALGANRSRR